MSALRTAAVVPLIAHPAGWVPAPLPGGALAPLVLSFHVLAPRLCLPAWGLRFLPFFSFSLFNICFFVLRERAQARGGGAEGEGQRERARERPKQAPCCQRGA